jgi:hypothetical protein
VGLGIVILAYNPSNMGGSWFKVSPGKKKKLARHYLNKHAYNHSYVGGVGKRIVVQGRQNCETLSEK